MTHEEREELRALLMKYSVRTGGDFLLASGQRSSEYVDAKLTTCKALGTHLVGKAFDGQFDLLLVEDGLQ